MCKVANSASGTELYLPACFLARLYLYREVRHILKITVNLMAESNKHPDFYMRTDISVTFPENTVPIFASWDLEQPRKSSVRERVQAFGTRNF
jgi:hypothetical protein